MEKLKARSLHYQSEAEGTASKVGGMSIKELKEALVARGVSPAGMLERSDLERALIAAPPTPIKPQHPPPKSGAAQTEEEMDAIARQDYENLMAAMQRMGGRGGGGSYTFENLIGKEAADRIGAAQERAKARRGGAPLKGTAIYTGSGFVEGDAEGDESPLRREELLELCERTGRASPTPGDALRYGTLFMRLVASFGGGDEGEEDARTLVTLIKEGGKDEAAGGPSTEFVMNFFLDAHGTTKGIKARFKEVTEKSGYAQKRRAEKKR